MDYSYNPVPTYSYGAGSAAPIYNPTPIGPMDTYTLPGSSIPSAPVPTVPSAPVSIISSPNPVVYPSPSTSVPAAPVSADPQLSTGPQTMPAQPVQYPLQQDPVPVQPSPYVSQPLPTPIQSDAYTPSIQSTPYVSQPLPTPIQSDAYTPSIQSTPYVSQPLPAPEQMGTPTAVADPNQLVAVNIVSSDPTSSSEPFTDVTLGTAPELVYCPHCHMNVMTKVENTSLVLIIIGLAILFVFPYFFFISIILFVAACNTPAKHTCSQCKSLIGKSGTTAKRQLQQQQPQYTYAQQ